MINKTFLAFYILVFSLAVVSSYDTYSTTYDTTYADCGGEYTCEELGTCDCSDYNTCTYCDYYPEDESCISTPDPCLDDPTCCGDFCCNYPEDESCGYDCEDYGTCTPINTFDMTGSVVAPTEVSSSPNIFQKAWNWITGKVVMTGYATKDGNDKCKVKNTVKKAKDNGNDKGKDKQSDEKIFKTRQDMASLAMETKKERDELESRRNEANELLFGNVQ